LEEFFTAHANCATAILFFADHWRDHPVDTDLALHFVRLNRTGEVAAMTTLQRTAARRLTPSGQGTIIFTGATASLRGKPPFTAFASAKAGLRSLAQSMAREFGPLGIHVAHVVIDGGIDGEKLNTAAPQLRIERGADRLLNIDAIAEAYWHLHGQHRSVWTHELDLRPFKERF
jgi:NAD(P)-dependent dehydrogenase (short-subunit alcohol dehydrogenase family)